MAGDPLELTVHEDEVTGVWTFTLQGHKIEVEPRRGFVKIDGALHQLSECAGLKEVEELAGPPLDAIRGLLRGDRASPKAGPPTRGSRPARVPQSPTPPSRPVQPPEGARNTSPKTPDRARKPPRKKAQGREEPGRSSPTATGRPVLDTRRAAAFLSLSPKTLEAHRTRGGGPPFIKLGRRVVYRQEDLDAWLAKRRRLSTSDPGPQES